jgi:hypothetical protein
MQDISKSDWKLFCSKVPGWQERYMKRLDEEYIELLSSDKPASTRFWELEKRIREDKKSKGVVINLRKSEALWDIVLFLRNGVIDKDDLLEFSDDLQENVNFLVERSRQEY